MIVTRESLYRTYGMCRPGLLRLDEQLPSANYYRQQFGSLDRAFQKLFDSERERARDQVHEQIRQHVPEVLTYSDFLVLDKKLALSIQPAVPVPHGYESYWPVSCDTRPVNVPLLNGNGNALNTRQLGSQIVRSVKELER